MCTNCGCSQVEGVMLHTSTGAHTHDHNHHHYAHHNHHRNHDQHHHAHHIHTLEVGERLLAKNDRCAQQNRKQLESCALFALNVMSSPGSGKTMLIEQTAKAWGQHAHRVGVIVGDLATENDAKRLRSAGATALQITTGSACHLEADMVAHALSHLDLANLELLVIENVGNLVCPAAYDLGETLRVVLLSVTEGEDKPLKYPTAFQAADVVIVTKTDIAAAIGFDRSTAIANIRHMAPQAQIFELSARTGVGMDDWLQYLRTQQPTRAVMEVVS